MASVCVEKDIAAPVERVFETLSDIPNADETISGITKIEMLSDGPVGVGTRWRETRVMFGKQATEEMEITEFNPNKNYVVEAESMGCHYRTDIRFQESELGTKVEMEFGAKPITFFAKLMTPVSWMMRGTMAKCLNKDLDDCKLVCESKSGE